MLSDDKITEISYLISARFEAVNSFYIKKMARQIKEIGKLGPANLHRLEQMMKMQQNIAEINSELMKATKLSLPELYQIYDISGLSVYNDAVKYYKANGINQVPFKNNVWIQNYIEAIKNRTAGTFLNIANTTAIQQDYMNLVDTAISAVSTGVTDYNSAIRAQLTDTAMQGMRVQYASGLTRRLDSAIRMNILEGVREINNGVREQTGKEFGADGVELSVHALCAADHLPYQGRQYSNKDFAKIQAGLKRKIGTCNCKHDRYPIILGISEPAYTEEELAQYKANSEQQVTLTTGYKKGLDEEGNEILIPKTKTVTKYQATQYQRNIETQIRYAKDVHIAAEASGDTVALEQSKQRIKALRGTYKRISEEAGLTPKWDRTYVPGYSGKQVTPKSIKINTINEDVGNTKTVEISHNIIEGKDITSTWERRLDKFDFAIDDILDKQGFNGLPKVVDANEFDKYVEDSNFIAQRTYSAPTQEILDVYQKELYEGKWYVDCSKGGAVYGQGMYGVYNKGTDITDYMNSEMRRYKSDVESNIETFTIHPEAKLIKSSQLGIQQLKVQQDILNGIKERGGYTNPEAIAWADAMSDQGTFAALLGYDGIIVDNNVDNYVVMLNRTKIIFKRG